MSIFVFQFQFQVKGYDIENIFKTEGCYLCVYVFSVYVEPILRTEIEPIYLRQNKLKCTIFTTQVNYNLHFHTPTVDEEGWHLL